MKLVLNATPLIHLTRAGLEDVFSLLKGEGVQIFTTPQVLHEVLERGKHMPDAGVVRALIDRGVVSVAEPKEMDFLSFLKDISAGPMPPLHEGEAEVLALAKEIGGIAIADEKAARRVGRIAKVEVHGSLYLLVLLYRRGRMDREEVIDAFKSMVKTGYRISPRDFTLIMEELERLPG